MKEKGRNVAASVQARLLQPSRHSQLSLQDLFECYCSERPVYRLSRSPCNSRHLCTESATSSLRRRFVLFLLCDHLC